jgi:hypothetical protein
MMAQSGKGGGAGLKENWREGGENARLLLEYTAQEDTGR